MKTTIFIAVVIFAIGSALAQTPPLLPQQFTANFTVVFPDYAGFNSLINIGGMIAFDWTNGGLFMDIGGEEVVPLSFHTNVVVSPSNNVLLPFLFEGPLCWQYGNVPAVITKYYPFQIPANYTFMGAQVINNEACTGWQFQVNLFGIVTLITPVTLWTSTKDGSIVQMVVDDIDYYGVNQIQVNFFNRVVGPFSPSIYAAPNKANPNLFCQPIKF